ncbi:MAG: YncE family protein [Acidobacteriota bacterium]
MISFSRTRSLSLLISLFVLALVTSGSAFIRATTPVSPADYKVVKKITLGGDGGWDYLVIDPATHRLYISRSTHVMVVDVDSGKVVGDIPNTSGVHGIALVPELNKGFTSNGRDNSVTVFDLKTLATTNKIPVGKNPDAIIYDPDSKLVFTCNGTSHDTTAIDPKSETVKGTIALDGRPESAVADEKGHVYINLEDKSMIAAIDSHKLTVAARWSLAPGEEPTGLAMDRKHRRLFAGCANKLMVVVNADNGHIVTTLPIGDGVDATAFDSSTDLAFSSNGEGTMTVIHEDSPDKFSVVGNVVTQRGARTMTLDPKTHKIFLDTAEFGPPPAPTAERPRPRPSIVPGSFTLLVVDRS